MLDLVIFYLGEWQNTRSASPVTTTPSNKQPIMNQKVLLSCCHSDWFTIYNTGKNMILYQMQWCKSNSSILWLNHLILPWILCQVVMCWNKHKCCQVTVICQSAVYRQANVCRLKKDLRENGPSLLQSTQSRAPFRSGGRTMTEPGFKGPPCFQSSFLSTFVCSKVKMCSMWGNIGRICSDQGLWAAKSIIMCWSALAFNVALPPLTALKWFSYFVFIVMVCYVCFIVFILCSYHNGDELFGGSPGNLWYRAPMDYRIITSYDICGGYE